MAYYALLDYDGYVCKAYFAAKARGALDTAWQILTDLTIAARDKAEEYFNSKVEMRWFMSGHTWKKDAFNTYKASRVKDPELKEFRDEVLAEEGIIKSKYLEADDLINMCVDYLDVTDDRDNYIVFSDDKDLHAVAKRYCKINLKEEVQRNEEPRIMLFAQMLAGDKEDDVTGIPKVGLKTAYKLLGGTPSLEKVVEVYKEKGFDRDYAKKNILLIKPMGMQMNEYPLSIMYLAGNILLLDELDDDVTPDGIKGEEVYLNKILDKIYNKEEQ
ncbi:MAG: hypothetical protein NC218_08150 [Acetobacter sp.]|nr:hypothetical protein [Acetobacter sp.]